MTLIDDLAVLEDQEKLLRFPSFEADDAWQLGNVMRRRLLECIEAAPADKPMGGTIEIEISGQLLFACATVHAKPGQADWIRRKRNTVRRFERSSYAVGLMLERDGKTLEGRYDLAGEDYAAHGGGFPIRIADAGFAGSAIVSGLPQRKDHSLVVASLAEILGIIVPVLSDPVNA